MHRAKHDGFHKEKYDPKKRKWEKFDAALLDSADKIIVYEEEHEALLKQYGYVHWDKAFNFDIPIYISTIKAAWSNLSRRS